VANLRRVLNVPLLKLGRRTSTNSGRVEVKSLENEYIWTLVQSKA
jgi:hypothetical protein